MKLFCHIKPLFGNFFSHHTASFSHSSFRASDAYFLKLAEQNPEFWSTKQPSLKAYEKVFGFVTPPSPNLTNLYNPDPVAVAEAVFWQEKVLHQWTKGASADGLKTAGMGLQELLEGHTKEAEEYFLASLKTDPEIIAFQFFLGESYRLQGDAKSALKFFKRSSLIYRGSMGPHLGSALVYWHLKDYARSERDFDWACQNNKDPMPWFFRGIMKAEAGNFKESLDHLAKAKACGGVAPEISRCYEIVQGALISGVSHSVDCGVDPLKVPVCIGV